MCDRACHASDGGGMPRAGGPAVCPCPAMAAESRAAPRDCGPTGAAQIIPDVGSGLPISASPSSTPLIAFPQRVQTMHPPLGRLFAKREDVMSYLGAFVAALFCAVLWKRAQSSRRRRRGETSQRERRTGVTIGNALQLLEEFVHPHTKHVLQERLKVQEDQDEGVESSNPAEHLLRQARRIQRGETVDITALWEPTDRS